MAFSAMGQASIEANARLAGAIALQASLTITPPTLVATIAALAEMQVQLQAAFSLGLPSVSFNLSACAALIAEIDASLNLLIQLGLLWGVGGLFAYTYAGTGPGLGAALTTELATQWPDGTPSSSACQAIIIGATESASWAAMTSFFGGA